MHLDGASTTGSQSPALDVVVVVCTGCRQYIGPCLASLEQRALGDDRVTVHVVDNASLDGTREEVQRFSWAKYHRLPSNFGFSRGNNVALRRATAPYVLLLNPDTEVPDGILDHLLGLMEDRPAVAATGCRLVDRAGIADHNAKRTFPTPSSALKYFAGRLAPRPVRPASPYQTPHLGEREVGEVDAVSGAFMLVRRSAMHEVGLLDEAYWMYGEDLDWCYRFKRAGWEVVYDGRVTVLHVKGGASRRKRTFRQILAFHLSMGRFYRKFYGGGQPLLDAAVYAAILARLGISAGHQLVVRLLPRLAG